LKVWRQSVTKLTFYSNLVVNWFSEKVPVYLALVNKALSPWIQACWEKISEISFLVWDCLKPARVWINETNPPLLEKISDEYVPKLGQMLYGWGLVVQQSLTDLGLWLQTNVFTGSFSIENMQRLAVVGVEKMQSYAGLAYGWAYDQYSAITSK